MKRSKEKGSQWRLVLVAISVVAVLVTLWLRNAPTPASGPTKAADMPVETAVTMGSSITEPSPTNQAEPVSSVAVQTSSQQGSAVVSGGPGATIRDAMAVPTVQSNQVSSFETTNPFTGPHQSLTNGKSKEQASKVGEQF